MIRVCFFASLKDAVGAARLELNLPEATTAEGVFRYLEEKYPDLSRYRPVVKVALNEEYVGWQQPVCAGDELAFFPPVSGGGL